MFFNILVIGSFSGGRRTFIETLIGTDVKNDALADYAVDIDVLPDSFSPRLFWQGGGTLGKLQIEDINLYFVVNPGSRLFQPLYEYFFFNIFGLLSLVDSSHSESFREFKSLRKVILNKLYPETFFSEVIVANKQDKPDALSVVELDEALHLEEKVNIVPCIAYDKESVKNVVIELLMHHPAYTKVNE